MASAAMVDYQEGATNAFVLAPYEGAQDNLLVSNTREDDNQGGYGTAIVGNPGWGTYDPPAREIMRFDLTSFAGQYASINSVKLTLTLNGGLASATMSVHQILSANSDWVEGISSGRGINDGESCWWYKAWSATAAHADWAGGFDSGCGTPDVDYDSAVLASYAWDATQIVAGDKLELTLTGDLDALIGQWCGPQADNAGLILRSDNEANGYNLSFRAAEAAEVADRPLLTIDYVPIPEPAALSLLALGLLGLRKRR